MQHSTTTSKTKRTKPRKHSQAYQGRGSDHATSKKQAKLVAEALKSNDGLAFDTTFDTNY